MKDQFFKWLSKEVHKILKTTQRHELRFIKHLQN